MSALQHTTIDGRPATIAHFDADMNLVAAKDAVLVKVVYTDEEGGVAFLTPEQELKEGEHETGDAWSEEARRAAIESRKRKAKGKGPWEFVVGSPVQSAVDPRLTGRVERFGAFGQPTVLVRWDNGWFEWFPRKELGSKLKPGGGTAVKDNVIHSEELEKHPHKGAGPGGGQFATKGKVYGSKGYGSGGPKIKFTKFSEEPKPTPVPELKPTSVEEPKLEPKLEPNLVTSFASPKLTSAKITITEEGAANLLTKLATSGATRAEIRKALGITEEHGPWKTWLTAAAQKNGLVIYQLGGGKYLAKPASDGQLPGTIIKPNKVSEGPKPTPVPELKPASVEESKPEPKPVKPETSSSWFVPFPESEKVGPQKGSNPGAVYQIAGDGEEWYVKQVPEDRARQEILANKLYREALASGWGVPTVLPVMLDGKTAVASKWIANASPLSSKSGAEAEAAEKKIRKHFAVDAWLANWDVIGTGRDNILVDDTTGVTRIDTGGCLQYRAQGGIKAFGMDVPEIETMRDPQKSKWAGPVFSKMSDDEVVASIRLLRSNVIDSAVKNQCEQAGVPNLAPILLGRLQWLVEYADKLEKGAKSATEAEKVAPLPTSAELFEKSGAKDYAGIGKVRRVELGWDKLGVTEEEAAAIVYYTNGGFDHLNNALRAHSLAPEMAWLASRIKTGLAKLPAHTGETRRRCELSKEVQNYYQVGKVVHEHAFASTTKNTDFYEKNTIFHITGTSGRDLTSASLHQHEKEVLYPAGTWFYVTKREEKGSTLHIWMEEFNA